jgi:hypothetical protein
MQKHARCPSTSVHESCAAVAVSLAPGTPQRFGLARTRRTNHAMVRCRAGSIAASLATGTSAMLAPHCFCVHDKCVALHASAHLRGRAGPSPLSGHKQPKRPPHEARGAAYGLSLSKETACALYSSTPQKGNAQRCPAGPATPQSPSSGGSFCRSATARGAHRGAARFASGEHRGATRVAGQHRARRAQPCGTFAARRAQGCVLWSRTLRSEECLAFARPRGGALGYRTSPLGMLASRERHVPRTHATVQHATHARVGGVSQVFAILKVKSKLNFSCNTKS